MVIDIPRPAEASLDYCAIESSKTGSLVSGKYGGNIKEFPPLPTLICCNFLPGRTKLSEDRWDVITMGEGILFDTSKDAVVDPQPTFPFHHPPPMPDLSGELELSHLLVQRSHLKTTFLQDEEETPASQEEASQEEMSQDAPAAPEETSQDAPAAGQQERETRVCILHPDQGKLTKSIELLYWIWSIFKLREKIHKHFNESEIKHYVFPRRV